MNFDVRVMQLGKLFQKAGYDLFLVGGSVRDAILGRPSSDFDFTTNARPDDTWSLLDGWADTLFAEGKRFGTIGAFRDGIKVEVTTYRADSYDGVTRKPTVEFGDSIEDDLARRDFTCNAIAMPLPAGWPIVDPFDGVEAILSLLLDTPLDPEVSFTDDPLRMLRAARFSAQLGFRPAPRVLAAMKEMRGELDRVSRERVRMEFEKILLAPEAAYGLTLAAQLVDFDVERIGWVARAPYDLVDRLVALQPTAEWLQEMTFPNAVVSEVLHLGRLTRESARAAYTPEATRRWIAEYGDLVDRVPHLAGALDALRTLDGPGYRDVHPPLSGRDVMAQLQIEPGPRVGAAVKFLQEERLRRGPMSRREAELVLDAWNREVT